MRSAAIIEDDEIVSLSIQSILRGLGVYDVRCFDAAAPFFACEFARHSDIVIVDLNLAGTSGAVIVERLAKSRTAKSIILMSADGLDEQISRRPAGVHFLQKPFVPDELAAAVYGPRVSDQSASQPERAAQINSAHDLLQPVTAAMNFVSAAEIYLKSGAAPDHVAEMLGSAKAQLRSLAAMVRRPEKTHQSVATEE